MDLGRKINDDREKRILLTYQTCVKTGLPRFIVTDVSHPSEMVGHLHLLLNDVWPPETYRIRPHVRSGLFLRFEERGRYGCTDIIAEWIGNRLHGVILVDAIEALRRRGRDIHCN